MKKKQGSAIIPMRSVQGDVSGLFAIEGSMGVQGLLLDAIVRLVLERLSHEEPLSPA